MIGAFPNVAQYLYCSGDTPFTVEFPTDPRISTSTGPMSLHAVLDFFQNAHCIIVGRSPPARACASAPSDGKKCVVNAVRSPRRYMRAASMAYLVLMSGSSP